MTQASPRIVAPVAAMLAGDHASVRLGIVVVEAAEGRAVATMVVQPDMVNGHGIAHGGMIFMLADTAFGCACNSWGPPTLGAGADISYISPGRTGDHLVAEANMRTTFGRHGIYDVTVRCGDRIVAEFRGRSTQPAVKS